MALKKTSVLVEIEDMQLREVKKDLSDEFNILEDGVLLVQEIVA